MNLPKVNTRLGAIMCRYAFKTYKPRYACFSCRQSFRLPIQEEMRQQPRLDKNGIRMANCPSCGTRIMNVGMDFKVPKRYDARTWKAAEILLSADIRYQGCGCDAGGWKPRTPKSALARVENQLRCQIQWNAERRNIERVESGQRRRDLRLQLIKQRNSQPIKP